MIHIIRRTRNPRIIPPTLPNKLQEVVHARQDIVHEYNRVEILVLRVPQLMQRHERRVPHLRQILNPMIERPPCAHRRLDLHPQPHAPAQRIKYPQQRLRLVRRPVLVRSRDSA